VVAPAEGQSALPAEWHLIWACDTCDVQPIVVDPSACSETIATLSSLQPPATAADSAAHLYIAEFCSSDNSPGAPAMFLLDLPGYSRAKFKVVALDPADPDSSRILESNEVTYNGGVADSYPAIVLHASSVHQSLQLRVTAVG
jgi:hypothetical protein